jgi:hypothetical protein
MKHLTLFLFCLFSFHSFAKSTSVDVLSSEFGFLDQHQRKTLCLTVIRVPQTGALLGVVESIQDCFYARAAKKSPDHKIRIDLQKLKKQDVSELHQYLQSLDAQLEFLFSDGE